MSFCDKCGAYVPIGDTVCPACGYDPEAEAKKAAEAAAALAVLGYTQQDISAALKGVDVETLPLEEIVRQSLKKMVK